MNRNQLTGRFPRRTAIHATKNEVCLLRNPQESGLDGLTSRQRTQRDTSVLGRTFNIQFLCINEATYLAGFGSQRNRTVVDSEVATYVVLPERDRVLNLCVFTARMGPPLGEQTWHGLL